MCLTAGVDHVGRRKMSASLWYITSVLPSWIPCQVSLLAEPSRLSYRRESVKRQVVHYVLLWAACLLTSSGQDNLPLEKQKSTAFRIRYNPPLEKQKSKAFRFRQSATGPAEVKGVAGQTQYATGAAEVEGVSGQTKAATGEV